MIPDPVIAIIIVALNTAVVCQAVILARRRSEAPTLPGPDDMPTMMIRKIEMVPRLERSQQVIYRPADYAHEHACVDPDCLSPRIAPGQVVERIPTSHSFLFVCLDCVERCRQRFAEAME